MTEISSSITSKGQVTIPAEVRRHLKVGTNDRILFVLRSDGVVEIKAPKYPDIRSLVGAAGSLGKNLSAREMREIAYEDRAEEWAKKQRD